MNETYSKLFNNVLTWLVITLFGGIGMAELIGFFEQSLSAKAALASFIPVMLGTGGNVGTQAATIAVRNLALDKSFVFSTVSMLWRELKVGTLLGLSFGLILGGYAFVRFEPKMGSGYCPCNHIHSDLCCIDWNVYPDHVESHELIQQLPQDHLSQPPSTY